MATDDSRLHQILDVIELARQEGDKETEARAVAAYKKESAAAEAAKLPEGAGETPAQGGFDTPFSVDAQAVEALKPALRGVASGVAAGTQNLVGLAKELGAGVVDFFDEVWSGKPRRDLARFPVSPDVSRARRVSDAERARRVTADELAKANDVPAGVRNATAALVESSPYLVGGFIGPMARASTAGGAILKNTLLATAEASLQRDSDYLAGNRAYDVLAAASGTAAITGATAALPATANVVVRGVQKLTKDSRAERAYQEAVKQFGDFPVSLGQRTGIPFIRTLETRSFNTQLQEFYAKQSDEFVAKVAQTLDQKLAPSVSTEGSLLVARKTLEDQIGKMRANRSGRWQAEALELKQLAKDAAGRPVAIPADNFFKVADSIVKDAKNPLRNIAKDILPLRVARTLSAVIDPSNRPVARLSAEETSDLLVGVNKLTGSNDDAARALGAQLKDALYKDVDNVPANAPGRAAADKIKEMRNGYAIDSQRILLSEESATAKMLGYDRDGSNTPLEPRKLLDTFGNMEKARQDQIVAWMGKHSPETLLAMRQEVVNAAVRRAGQATGSANSQISLPRFTKQFLNSDEGDEIRSLALFTRAEQDRMQGIKKALSVLENVNVRKELAGTAVLPEDVAINVTSRAAPFVARQIGRVLTGVKSSKFLTDPQVYAKLTTLKNTRGITQDIVRTSLVKYLQDNYPDEEPEVPPAAQ